MILDLCKMSYVLVNPSLFPFDLVDYLLMDLSILDGNILDRKFFAGSFLKF